MSRSQSRTRKRKRSSAPAPSAEASAESVADDAPDAAEAKPAEVGDAAEPIAAEVSSVSDELASGEAEEAADVANADEADADEADADEAAVASAADEAEETDADAAEDTVPEADEAAAAAADEEAEEVDPEELRLRQKRAIESLIFVTERPVTGVQLGRLVKLRLAQVKELVAELMAEYEGRGVELVELGGGYVFRSAPSSAPFVRDFVSQRPVRLTRAQLETLALVAYRQPITRPEIDDVRGVDTGSACRVLLERGLIKIIGRKDEPGRPLLYGTTPTFLEFFGLRSLKDLPTLREFADLTEESRELFKAKTGEAAEDVQATLAAEADEEAAEEDFDPAALAAELAEDGDDYDTQDGPTGSPERDADDDGDDEDEDDDEDAAADGTSVEAGGDADERMTAAQPAAGREPMA